MTYFFNIYIYYVDIFIIVFYLPYYCNIRYVVLSFDELKTHYYYLLLLVCEQAFGGAGNCKNREPVHRLVERLTAEREVAVSIPGAGPILRVLE